MPLLQLGAIRSPLRETNTHLAWVVAIRLALLLKVMVASTTLALCSFTHVLFLLWFEHLLSLCELSMSRRCV